MSDTSPSTDGQSPSISDLQLEPVPLHFKIPHGFWLHEATSVAVDSQDNVYVFNRGNMPVLVFDISGNLIRYWGNSTPYEGTTEYTDPYGNKASRWIGTEFVRPHAITIDHEDNVWLVDDIANTITKCNTKGDRKMMLCPGGLVLHGSEMTPYIGVVIPPPERQSGKMFNRPTDVAIHPRTGDIFITDGYNNSCVHRLKADGTHLKTWGGPGTDPGQFNLPHNITLSPQLDMVIVADRENSRVQFFTLDGKFVKQWPIHRAVSVSTDSRFSTILIAEQGTSSGVQKGDGMQSSQLKTWTPNIGHRIGIYTPDGKRLATIGSSTPGEHPEKFNYLHSVATNSRGEIYAAEVSFCECGRWQKPHARELPSLRKWRTNSLIPALPQVRGWKQQQLRQELHNTEAELTAAYQSQANATGDSVQIAEKIKAALDKKHDLMTKLKTAEQNRKRQMRSRQRRKMSVNSTSDVPHESRDSPSGPVPNVVPPTLPIGAESRSKRTRRD